MSKLVQLVVSCVVLGTGVALLFEAALGSDGYSTLVNGLSVILLLGPAVDLLRRTFPTMERVR